MLIALLASAGFVLLQTPREPGFGGRPLTDWLKGIRRPGGAPSGTYEALDAMSPACFPYMLSMMRAQDSPLRGKVNLVLARIPWLRFRLPPSPSPTTRWAAARGFVTLGKKAQPAVPGLAKLLLHPDTAGQATCALASIKTEDARRAIEVGLRHPEVRVRQTILGPLEVLGPEDDAYVPALMERLTDSDAWVRENAARLLGIMQARPNEVVPALANRLHDPSTDVRRTTARALRAFGPRARPAVPALQTALRKNDPTYRQAVADALSAINPPE